MTRTILILCALLLGETHAAELHVGPGQQHETLPSAVLASQAGDTIVVHPGEYPLTAVRVKVPLTIRGIGMPVFSAEGMNLNNTIAVPRAIIEIHEHADGTMLYGLRMIKAHNGGSNAAGVRIISADRVKIIKCEFEQCDNGIFCSGEADEVDDLMILRCKLRNNGTAATSHPIYLSEGKSVIIAGNEITTALQGQLIKLRTEDAFIYDNDFSDSKNRSWDFVQSASTESETAEYVVMRNRVRQRFAHWDSMTGQYVFRRDGSVIANTHMAQLNVDGAHLEIKNRVHLFYMENTHVGWSPTPMFTLGAPDARLTFAANHFVRPENVERQQGRVQTLLEVTRGELGDRLRAWENRFSIDPLTGRPFVQDWNQFTEEP